MTDETTQAWLPSEAVIAQLTVENRSYPVVAAAGDECKIASPMQFLLAALASCFAVSLRLQINARKLEEPEILVRARYVKADGRPARAKTFMIEVDLGTRLDVAVRLKLIQAAERVCTVSNTLAHGASIELIDCSAQAVRARA